MSLRIFLLFPLSRRSFFLTYFGGSWWSVWSVCRICCSFDRIPINEYSRIGILPNTNTNTNTNTTRPRRNRRGRTNAVTEGELHTTGIKANTTTTTNNNNNNKTVRIGTKDSVLAVSVRHQDRQKGTIMATKTATGRGNPSHLFCCANTHTIYFGILVSSVSFSRYVFTISKCYSIHPDGNNNNGKHESSTSLFVDVIIHNTSR